jgi:serine/threonine-protein kinase
MLGFVSAPADATGVDLRRVIMKKVDDSKKNTQTITSLSTGEGKNFATTSTDNAFGFKSDNLNIAFLEEGLGSERAMKLAERFHILSPIHRGGMGKIILAQEIISGRHVALKVMLEYALHDKPLIQQFVREAVITARLQHPNIIPVYDIGFLTGNQLYYTMRYIDGKSYNQLIGTIELNEQLRILRSAASAVHYAHTQGLWHRDLKPNNILVGFFGDVYVIDWGLVTVQPGREYKINLPRIVVEKAIEILPDKLFERTRDALTEDLMGVMGTLKYMAPEQVRGEGGTGAVSDIWAFGVMLFESLTGRHPIGRIDSFSPQEIMYNIATQSFPNPRDISEDTPVELNKLCQRMLIKKPNDRMQTLMEFISEITRYLKSQRETVLSFSPS